ncbi:uncharacterized protein TNCV_3737701 [Trichonephila clavipes]|nr:uncharacterized protein TNCV_3737701 [Trichonephila clavipes]
MQVSSGTKNSSSHNEPSCTTVTVFSWWLRVSGTLHIKVRLGATCAVTSPHITIILESLPKPGDNTLGDSKFLGYFQLGTSTFQPSNNCTT